MANPRTIENRRQKLLKSQQKPTPAISKKAVSKSKKKISRQTAAAPPAPAPQIVTPPKKVAPPIQPAPQPVPEVKTVDYSSMTKSQIQEVLKERGIAYLPQSTKRILLGILKDA